ncbi:hypothetical protein HN51_036431, partial [Arachis hypogaea]
MGLDSLPSTLNSTKPMPMNSMKNTTTTTLLLQRLFSFLTLTLLLHNLYQLPIINSYSSFSSSLPASLSLFL